MDCFVQALIYLGYIPSTTKKNETKYFDIVSVLHYFRKFSVHDLKIGFNLIDST